MCTIICRLQCRVCKSVSESLTDECLHACPEPENTAFFLQLVCQYLCSHIKDCGDDLFVECVVGCPLGVAFSWSVQLKIVNLHLLESFTCALC